MISALLRFPRLSLWVLALALLIASVAGVTIAFADQGDRVGSLDIPLYNGSRTAGLTWDGSYYRVIRNPQSGLSGDPSLVQSYTQPGSYTASANFNITGFGYPRDLTWDGARYYVVVNANSGARVYSYSSIGTAITSFTLASANDNAAGIAWDGTHLRVVDYSDDKVYAYNRAGAYISSEDFDLDDENVNPVGITWDGTHFRVTDSQDDKVYSYSNAGAYISSEDFVVVSVNNVSSITWDEENFRILVAGSGGSIQAYEGPAEPEVLGATVTAPVSVYGDWKCLRSPAGVNLRLNNAALTVHGFCAQAPGVSSMDVEIHMADSTSYSDLQRFVTATGGTWEFHESGAPDSEIYRDRRDSDSGDIAFTEDVGEMANSNRLGFATVAKSITDADCVELITRGGFTCDRTALSTLLASDTGVLQFFLSADNAFESAVVPLAPDSISVSRTADYETATVSWTLYSAVVEYQLERLVAVTVSVSDATRIEYGDPVTYTITGTQAGIDEYEDSTVEANRTYQYRIRAKGADDTWSDWSDFVFSGGQSAAAVESPANLELSRGPSSVVASWSEPSGEYDNFTLQRQELVVVEGSVLFANVVTLHATGSAWLPATDTMYTDDGILPGQTYEYRVAAVLGDKVGEYTDWFRITPTNTSLGTAPDNFRFLDTMDTVREERREFWMEWDEVPGADTYEVHTLVYNIRTGGQSMDKAIVSDATFFETAFGRVELRVRGRKSDADLCGAEADDYCFTDWSGWYGVRFTPAITIAAPPTADDTSDADIMELRTAFEEVVEGVMEPSGAPVDAGRVAEFLVVVAGLVMGGMSLVLAWRRGMAPLGFGMGAAILILILFAGWRLLGTNAAWPVAAQAVVAVAGMVAAIRQLGVFR